MDIPDDLIDRLDRDDLIRTLKFMRNCLMAENEDAFHELILDFSGYLGFEYVLYCYMKHEYISGSYVHFVNLTYPQEWRDEYDRKNYLEHDPVRIELERMLNTDNSGSFIYWDKFDRPISDGEKMVIKRRNEYGFLYGCSVFDVNKSKEISYLITLGSGQNMPDERTEIIMSTVISHLAVVRKKLNITQLTGALTARESAVADLLAKGKSNCEIAVLMKISESTVKFHLSNMYGKLKVTSRQEAAAIWQASKYLCL